MKVTNHIIKNIYYMLAYAFSMAKQSGFDRVGEEDFDDIHNLFAALLAAGIGRQLKQGLHREYITHNDDLAVVRGKIDIAGTIRNRINCVRRIACEFDELAENNIFNRIIKTTVLLLLESDEVETKYKSRLKQEMLFFSEVDVVDPFAINWSQLRFERNNQTYRILIGLCKFLLDGMLISENGERKLASFMDEEQYPKLYETFILEYYRKHHPELNASAKKIKWALDADPPENKLPEMQSDTMLFCGKKILIIDAKFYESNAQGQYKQTNRSAHLYQIFAYVKNQSLASESIGCDVSGLLLYARTEEEFQPDADYSMSGNNISIKTLNLNKPFKNIAAQLDEIAKRFKQSASVDPMHVFAEKWRNICRERNFRRIAEEFDRECGKLGLKTEETETFHTAWNDDEKLAAFPESETLANGIFAKWRNYATPREERVLEKFEAALARLAELTRPRHAGI